MPLSVLSGNSFLSRLPVVLVFAVAGSFFPVPFIGRTLYDPWEWAEKDMVGNLREHIEMNVSILEPAARPASGFEKETWRTSLPSKKHFLKAKAGNIDGGYFQKMRRNPLPLRTGAPFAGDLEPLVISGSRAMTLSSLRNRTLKSMGFCFERSGTFVGIWSVRR